ncbi:MAG: ORF6N domain-containing protein [Fibrobacter sp.]|nr:ORF6N domain-containing protein [Fibrobacter sp.]
MSPSVGATNTTKSVEKPNFSLIDENFLKSRIYTIRGVKVMLDADLAEIYGYSTKRFNEQVKNNIEKFDEDFRFQLTSDEVITCSRPKKSALKQENLRSKKSTSSWGGLRYSPYAFTEQGIYMLMTVLKGEQAVTQSKALIRLFKQMKDYIVAENQHLLGNASIAEIAVQTAQNTKDITIVSADVRELSGEVHDIRDDLGKMNLDLQKVMENFIDPSTFKHFLILDGQKLEADIAYMKIYSMARKSIIIIDNYVGVKTLDLLHGIAKNANVHIFSEEWGDEKITPAIKADYEKARPDVSLKIDRPSRKFHDRYVFLDYGLPSEKLFLCGASSKDAGNKVTTIMQIECTEFYHPLVESLKTENS